MFFSKSSIRWPISSSSKLLRMLNLYISVIRLQLPWQQDIQNILGLEQYWYWVIGYWAIFTDIGWYCYWGIFFVVLTPNTIPIRQQSAPSTCQWTIILFPFDLYSHRCNCLSGHHADMLLFIKHNHCHHHRVLGFFAVIAMLYTSIGIGIGYWYRYRPILFDIGYWVPFLVSF